MIVLAVFLVVGFIVATFVTVSARSPIPLAVAFLLLASSAYPLWLMARAYGIFHRAYSLILPVGPVAFYGRSWLSCDFVCDCFGVGATESVPPPNPLMRILGYFVGLTVAAVYARTHMDLAEDTSTIYFKYTAVAEILSALFSFIPELSLVIGLIGLVLFFVAVREAREELLNRMLAGK
jgi:hypothetical protein